MQTPLLLGIHDVKECLGATLETYGFVFHGPLEEIVKHEFECHFYGKTFRDLTVSPLEEYFDNNRVPTDYRHYIYSVLAEQFSRLIDRIVDSQAREYYHYQLEWVDNLTVYLHRLEPTLTDTSSSSLEGLLCSY